ncbi:pilus assembly protein [Pseudokineococcus sp. 5B2Z-1]|uniref:pilus assembly protein n=1 Tax=Pseudokineococcus sp. 5B2Z-1 TaxID=3132744 RepID=UPI0030A87C8A
MRAALPAPLVGVRRRVRDLRGDADRGSAVVEFVGLGVLLLVPVVYLVIAVAQLQAGAFGAEAGAREAARVIASASGSTSSAARADAEAVVALALEDQGVDPASARLDVRCDADPCGAGGSLVRTTVQLEVVLPGVPAPLAAVVPARVPVEATGTAAGNRFAGAP